MTSNMGRRKRRLAALAKSRASPSKPGAVGICGSCGHQVLLEFVDDAGRHTAILTYGRNRVRCGGSVIPLRSGAFAVKEVR